MRLLFATDLTEAPSVTDAIAALAKRLDAELWVLHVYQPTPAATSVPLDPLTGIGDFTSYAFYDPTMERNMEAAEEHAFKAFLTERFSMPVHAAIRTGDSVEVILDDADEHDADMIVLGKHHHSRLERWLLGTTGREVVEQAERPVLVMPAEPGS